VTRNSGQFVPLFQLLQFDWQKKKIQWRIAGRGKKSAAIGGLPARGVPHFSLSRILIIIPRSNPTRRVMQSTLTADGLTFVN